jgi:hypothetical protein
MAVGRRRRRGIERATYAGSRRGMHCVARSVNKVVAVGIVDKVEVMTVIAPVVDLAAGSHHFCAPSRLWCCCWTRRRCCPSDVISSRNDIEIRLSGGEIGQSQSHSLLDPNDIPII